MPTAIEIKLTLTNLHIIYQEIDEHLFLYSSTNSNYNIEIPSNGLIPLPVLSRVDSSTDILIPILSTNFLNFLFNKNNKKIPVMTISEFSNKSIENILYIFLFKKILDRTIHSLSISGSIAYNIGNIFTFSFIVDSKNEAKKIYNTIYGLYNRNKNAVKYFMVNQSFLTIKRSVILDKTNTSNYTDEDIYLELDKLKVLQPRSLNYFISNDSKENSFISDYTKKDFRILTYSELYEETLFLNDKKNHRHSKKITVI